MRSAKLLQGVKIISTLHERKAPGAIVTFVLLSAGCRTSLEPVTILNACTKAETEKCLLCTGYK